MSASRRSKLRRIGVLALVSGCITLGVSVTGAPPAGADVTQTSSSAFGAFAQLLGLELIPATPVAEGSGPPFDYGPFTQTTAGVGLPAAACPVTPGAIPLTNIIDVCAIEVDVAGFDNFDAHRRIALASAEIAGVAVGTGPNGLLTLELIQILCSADGDTAEAEMNLAGSTLGGNPLLSGPIAPNTAIQVPGVASVILNEQIPATDPDTPGINTIAANAVHIVLLDNTEVILGHVECTAQGPDVNRTTLTIVDPTLFTTTTSSTTTVVPPPPPTTAGPGGGGGPNNNTNTNDNSSNNDNTNTNTNNNDQNQTNNQSQTGGNNSNENVINILGSNFDVFHDRGHFANDPHGKALARTGSESRRLTGLALLLLLIGGALVLGTRPATANSAPRRRTGWR